MTSKLTREQATDKEIQMLIDSHENGTAMFLRVDAYYLMAKELQERRKAAMDSEPVGTLSVRAMSYSGKKFGTQFGFVHSDAAMKVPEGDYPLYRHAQPAPVVLEGLNPETADLVLRFASALADKLYKAEQKYGRSTDWMKSDWYDDCLQSLWEHIEKGDPRDVAAYCAFMWHHGWVTADYDRNVQNACRAAMLQENPKSAGESNNCRSNGNMQDLKAGNSPAHSGLHPEQSSGSPAQDVVYPAPSPIDHGYRPDCECSGCKATARICAELAGNSPVIPDAIRDALLKALSAMEFMGDTLNNLDAVCAEDAEFVAPAFEAVRRVLAAAPQEAK
ncbi:hypothetical protein [Raoultella sp. HC6]|uniref:hypothetical protein n=1 Tax=Raoultella sp. HC6 TaxID=2923366 RepID=UPI001F5101AF|nr:hypothetical protein [Raoultella sp. HC6]